MAKRYAHRGGGWLIVFRMARGAGRAREALVRPPDIALLSAK